LTILTFFLDIIHNLGYYYLKGIMDEQLSLPQTYPLSIEARTELKRALPPSKIAYNEKYLTPFITNIQKTLIQSISLQLDIAAQKYNFGLLNDDEYTKQRDTIYQSLINGSWINDIHDAFQKHAISIDAYSLLLESVFKHPSKTITIDNLYEYVAEENEALEKTGKSQNILLSECFENHKNTLRSNLRDSSKNESKKEIFKIKQIIFVATYPDRPIPFSLENDLNENDDDDLEVGGGKVDLTCPISRNMFIRPYKNINCNHTYDLEPLKVYLRSSRVCPECGASVSMTNIEPDSIMQTRIECYKRDQKNAELLKDRNNDDIDKL
jgi:hypothetical protein